MKLNKNLQKIIIIAGLIILFLINTFLVVFNKYHKIDALVYSFITINKSDNLTIFMKIITVLGGVKFMIILAIFLFVVYYICHAKNKAFVTAAILLISTIINNIIKLLIKRPRPEFIMVLEKSFSYPSGHVMAATTLYGLLIYYLTRRKLKKPLKILGTTLLLLLIFLIAISRIYLGAHYFSDVFGAIVLSVVLIITLSLVVDKKGLL